MRNWHGIFKRIKFVSFRYFRNNSKAFQNKLYEARSIALDDLEETAKSYGANAIIGVDMSYTTFTENVIGVIANGTAVRIEAITNYNLSHAEAGGMIKSIPVISYYQNLPIRPFLCTLNSVTKEIKISIYRFHEENLHAINVDVEANTIFGSTYHFPDINFVDLHADRDVIDTEENELNINSNQLKVIESMIIKINQYIIDGKTYSANESYQISDIPIQQLLTYRQTYGNDVVGDFHDDPSHWICMCGYINGTQLEKCAMCNRNKDKYKRMTIGELMPKLIELQSSQEILAHLKDIEQNSDDHFPDAIMNEVEKIVKMEKLYGDMKDSLIHALKKYVSENE